MEGMDGAKVKVRAYGENDTFGVWSEKKEVSGVDSTGGVEVHTVDIPYQGKTERSCPFLLAAEKMSLTNKQYMLH